MRHRNAHIYLALFLSMSLVFAPGLSALGASSDTPKIQNNELVISTLGEQGTISSIQVLSHLRAYGSGTATIQEDQNFKLSSVRNLYGKEKISVKDNKLSVNLNMGNDSGYGDVYYMSDLDKSEISNVKMPVSVKVSYYLDGQKMEPSKMAGKSGHLKIVTELENLTGVKKSLDYKDSQGKMVKTEAQVYTPFVVSLSGWEFDNKIFSHVVAPGVSGKSAEGVVVDVQSISTVTWTVPLIPPAYPAKQYTTVEADAKNIVLPSFNIAVVPIIPATAAEDTLGTFQDSFSKLFDAFGQIKDGAGAPDKEGTLLFGLSSMKDGLGQLSDGIATLGGKVKELLIGVSNTNFKAATYDVAKGTDGSGNSPGVREAVKMGKSALDTQVIPAMEGQKQVLTGLEAVVGKSVTAPVQPAASTSLYNDTAFLRGLLGGAFKGNAKFNAATYIPLTGVDANGNKPDIRDAVKLGKAALDTQVIPGMEGQKQVLDGLGAAVGTSGTTLASPSASTSLYNDVTFLKGYLTAALAGNTTALQTVNGIIDTAMTPKLVAVGHNLTALKSGGTLIVSIDPITGAPVTVQFPAGVTTVEQGIKDLSGKMELTDAGLGQYAVGVDTLINTAMVPKLGAVGNNLTVLKSGGTLITPTGPMAFPASVNTVEQGIQTLSGAMAKTDAGLGLISAGIGPIDANGQAIKAMVDGKPSTILYALSYFESSLDGEALPGLDQLLAGSSQIGDGAGQAQTEIRAGLDKMSTAPAIISALTDNAAQSDTFLGKPDGAQAAVAYIYQTPQVSRQGTVMNYGLGAIVIVLIILFAVGRPPRVIKSVQDASQTI